MKASLRGRAVLWVLGRVPRSMLNGVANLQWRSPLIKRVFDLVVSRLNHQDGRIQQGVGAGLAFNPGGSNAGYLLGTSEPAVQRAFKALIDPGAVVYDVGANVGFHSVLAARLVGETGTVVAFEPLEANTRWVRHNAALNAFTNVRVRAEALGDANGAAAFQVSSVSSWGRLSELQAPPGRAIGTTQVRLRTLDSVLAEPDPPPPPSLMKIDVEGAETRVLEGARATLRSHRPLLMIELHGTRVEVEPLLADLDYTICTLGSPEPLVARPWDAYVLAAPSERADLIARITRLTDPSVGTR